jgi:salicylate hydroxylase
MIIAGGGIGGLAAALACGQAGARPQVLERAATFSEVGAGIQMGPNVTRTLHAWGLAEDLKEIGFVPRKLDAKDTQTGQIIGTLRLGQRSLDTYGAPYFTVHRADLHRVFLKKIMSSGQAELRLDSEVQGLQQNADGIQISGTNLPASLTELSKSAAMVGADGLWSKTRQFVVPPTAPRVTGLLAYRALVPMQSIPEKLRLQDVNVWAGPRVHAVLYPVKCGEYLNLVVVVQGPPPASLDDWDHAGNKQDLEAAMGPIHVDLRNMLAAVPAWRLWPLCDRPPIKGPHEMAKGRIALLGDAAELARSWARADLQVEDRLQMYAQARWARNAQVQQRSIRNGQIFHLQGPLRWGRNAAMKLLGEPLMDVPWLYAGP